MKTNQNTKEKKEMIYRITYSYKEYDHANIPESVVEQGEDAMIEWIEKNVNWSEDIEIVEVS